MALFAWNHDGKKDWQDDYFEYHYIYKPSQKKDYTHSSNTYKSGNTSPNACSNLSTFGAIVSLLSGLVIQAILYMLLGIDVEDVPVIVMIILWIVFSSIVAVILDEKGV